MSLSVILSSFFSGLLGSMGFGGGSVLIVYLTMVLGMPQKTAQGINLLFFLPSAAVSAFCYIKQGLVSFKKLLPFALTGMVGTVLGFYLLRYIPGDTAGKLFGGFLTALGIKDLISSFKKTDKNTVKEG